MILKEANFCTSVLFIVKKTLGYSSAPNNFFGFLFHKFTKSLHLMINHVKGGPKSLLMF